MAETVPCSGCGRRDPFKRYRGARFGVVGFVCPNCRSRLARRQKAQAEGRTVRGRRPSPDRPARVPRPRAGRARGVVSPEEVAETIRVVREEAERAGRRPRPGVSEIEDRQRHWAELATAERRRVVETRRPAWALA